MKTSLLALASLIALANASHGVAQNAKAAPAPAPAASPPLPDALKDPKAQIGYAIGLNIGSGIKHDDIAVDPEMIARGVSDALSGAKPMMSEEQARTTLTQLQVYVQGHRRADAAKAAESNKAEGAGFLKANGAKPGVVTLPSGLQYQIMTQGKGPIPKLTDTVVCNYRGTLLNGTEFDSSYARGTPASFPVGGVIKGWTEALQKMPVGSKWRLFVPADLAYGDKGAGEAIGPNATLIFDVELLSIAPPTQ